MELRRSERIRNRKLKEAAVNQERNDPIRNVPEPDGNQEQQKPRSYAIVKAWLGHANIQPPEIFDPDQIRLHESEIGSISEISVSTIDTFSGLSTLLVPRRHQARNVCEDDLRARNIHLLPFPARGRGAAGEFANFKAESPIKITFDQTTDLQKTVEDFLAKARTAAPGDDGYSAIEEMCTEINSWKATVRLPTITNQEFKDGLERFRGMGFSHDSSFRRTILMSLINHSYLKNVFDFSCEAVWALNSTRQLPVVRGPDNTVEAIPNPKPDIAISFRPSSMATDRPSVEIPPKLKSCAEPEQYSDRRFPFLFIETGDGLQENFEMTLLANMYHASQALFNIYTVMHRAGHDAIFFRDVRVFSITINAFDFIARAHRASPREVDDGKTQLEFHFEDIVRERRWYSRDHVCTLVQNILNDYAEPKLLGILRDTVKEVVDEYEEEQDRRWDARLDVLEQLDRGRPYKKLKPLLQELDGGV
ncbi:hypothetical protein F4777DRAFT_546222 [Nemania sp. FL0916]|nr:hypothetical protein F4777DRAFT_546222 [Nemania sp. FL0916]